MISTNMLSANKVKLHGMTSTKWTTKDKITQYKGLINLYTRDKKIIEMDTIIAQKKQTKEVKNLQKEIEGNRKDLDNAIRGDKQKLRNTLAEHREMQLAFQNAQPQKVIDMVHQVNFTKRKNRDIMKYRMKLKSDKLVELKLKYSELEDRLKYDGQSWQTMLPSEREAHLITGKVQDAILKKEAAIYIRNSYKEMTAIMKRDALYFDAILVSIRNDGLSQGKCMINATKLGQLGTEYLDDRRQEFQFLEKIVKKDMVSRKRDLAMVRQNVEHFSMNLKNLLRRDSDINLGVVELPISPSFVNLQDDINTIESTLRYLKDSIFTPTIESIFPCIKEQVHQKERLTEFVEKCENSRNELLQKANHAATMRSKLENTMLDTTGTYNIAKRDYLSKIDDEKEKKAELEKLIKNRYNLLANVRISLRHLQLLSKLVSTGTKSISIVGVKMTPIIQKKTKLMDSAESSTGVYGQLRRGSREGRLQGNIRRFVPLKIIPELTTKFSRLVSNAKEILSGTGMEEGYRIFEAMMRERTKPVEVDVVISEESLIESVFMDAHVLTRDDIKKKSAEIVAQNVVDDELKPAQMPKKRFVFKK